MNQPGRMFLCGRCRAQVVLCSRCDRGNVYCGPACSQARRRVSVREAGMRYQGSRAGRFAHAARSQRYRARGQNVTHQGSAVCVGVIAFATLLVLFTQRKRPFRLNQRTGAIGQKRSSRSDCFVRCSQARLKGIVGPTVVQ